MKIFLKFSDKLELVFCSYRTKQQISQYAPSLPFDSPGTGCDHKRWRS